MSETSSLRIGIFPKILFVMLLVSVIPLVVNWYISNINNTDRISAGINQRLQDTATGLGTFIDGWMDMNVHVLRQNAMLSGIKSMQPEKQKPILQSILNEYNWSYLVFTIDPDGKNISRSDDKALKDYSDRVYVKQVVTGRPLGQQVLMGKTSGKPSLVISTAIRNEENKITGVLAMGMTLTEISERVASSKIENTGFAFLMDEFGKVIAHPNQEFTNKRQDFSGHPAYLKLTPGKTSHITYTEDNKKVVAIVTPIKQGWTLVVQQDYDEAFAEIGKSNQQAIILFLITFALSLIVAIIVSRRLARPIKRLTQVADDISRGTFHAEIEDIRRSDELGDLAKSVERLGISVKLATERLTR